MVTRCSTRPSGRDIPFKTVLFFLHDVIIQPTQILAIYHDNYMKNKALNGLAPLYVLCDMLERYIPACRLRSSDDYLLNVPRYNLKSYGGRAFSVVAPELWNNLPLDIKLSPKYCEYV